MGAVVEVALEPPLLAVGGLDDAYPRAPQLLEVGAELGLQPGVLQRDRAAAATSRKRSSSSSSDGSWTSAATCEPSRRRAAYGDRGTLRGRTVSRPPRSAYRVVPGSQNMMSSAGSRRARRSASRRCGRIPVAAEVDDQAAHRRAGEPHPQQVGEQRDRQRDERDGDDPGDQVGADAVELLPQHRERADGDRDRADQHGRGARRIGGLARSQRRTSTTTSATSAHVSTIAGPSRRRPRLLVGAEGEQHVAGHLEEREPQQLERPEHEQDRPEDQPVAARPQVAATGRSAAGRRTPPAEPSAIRIPSVTAGPVSLHERAAGDHDQAVDQHDRPVRFPGHAALGYESWARTKTPPSSAATTAGWSTGRSSLGQANPTERHGAA